jgi:histone deacetylase 6
VVQNSLVFVSHAHGLWHNDSRRKPSKRYGRLIESPKTGLNEMLLHHKPNVVEWIDTRINMRSSSSSEEPEDNDDAGLQKA